MEGNGLTFDEAKRQAIISAVTTERLAEPMYLEAAAASADDMLRAYLFLQVWARLLKLDAAQQVRVLCPYCGRDVTGRLVNADG